ncbi:glycosyltransferase, partial [Alistipes putredinis]|uniref:glycosyltransferase n=1 Tax=Alistipes putredinis TaxID=28117 RepID=UPI00210A291B|nr:glycosyltransferase [Alistipes putredinis]
MMSLEGGYHLLVGDDGSRDGTGASGKERQAEFPDRLFLLDRSGKLGLGTAYIEGFRLALARPYEAVFEMDCDFSHN